MNSSKQISRVSVFALALTLVMLLAGPAICDPPSASQPRVFFISPADGAIVSSPVKVTMGSDNFIVEPAGEVKPGAGHLHIMVDTDCVEAGKVVPKDDTHLHYGKGQMDAELKLAPGKHTLCLQAADGTHVALPGDGMMQKITITVK